MEGDGLEANMEVKRSIRPIDERRIPRTNTVGRKRFFEPEDWVLGPLQTAWQVPTKLCLKADSISAIKKRKDGSILLPDLPCVCT